MDLWRLSFPITNTTTIECRNERIGYRLLHAWRATGLTGTWSKGSLARTGSVASSPRAPRATCGITSSQQNRKKKVACVVPYVRGDNIYSSFCEIWFLYEYTYVRVSCAGNIIPSSCSYSSTVRSTRAFVHSRCCKRSCGTGAHGGCLGGWVGYGWVSLPVCC